VNVEHEIGRLSGEAQDLGEFLEKACKLRQKAVTRASEEAGLSRNSISSFILGSRRPSVDSVHALARYFGVPERNILRLAGHTDTVPAAILEGLGEVVGLMVRSMDAEELNEWIQFGEMLLLRRQRRMMEERHEVEG